MIPALDIFRSAQVLVKQHGPDAPIHAAMRADAMLDKGDLDGPHAGIPMPKSSVSIKSCFMVWGRG